MKRKKEIHFCPKCRSTELKSTIIGSPSFTTTFAGADAAEFAFYCQRCNFTLPSLSAFPKTELRIKRKTKSKKIKNTKQKQKIRVKKEKNKQRKKLISYEK